MSRSGTCSVPLLHMHACNPLCGPYSSLSAYSQPCCRLIEGHSTFLVISHIPSATLATHCKVHTTLGGCNPLPMFAALNKSATYTNASLHPAEVMWAYLRTRLAGHSVHPIGLPHSADMSEKLRFLLCGPACPAGAEGGGVARACSCLLG